MLEQDTDQPSPAPDNDATPVAQPLQPGQAALQLTPQGLVAATVVQIGIDAEHMHQIVREWLKLHPELATELLQAHIAQLQATKSHLTLVKPDTAPVRHANKRSKLLK